jgi:murein DD-endopeptidase MepM/ murein hydrolase activator NlpD
MTSMALFGLIATATGGSRPLMTIAKTEVTAGKDAYMAAAGTIFAGDPAFRHSGELSSEYAVRMENSDSADVCGAPVGALYDGFISEVKEGGWNDGKGSYVKIEGARTVSYIHLGEIATEEGVMVEKGDLIALTGRSGLPDDLPCVRETE